MTQWWPVLERLPADVSPRRTDLRQLVVDAERIHLPDLVASAYLSGRTLVVLGRVRTTTLAVARSRVRRWARTVLRRA